MRAITLRCAVTLLGFSPLIVCADQDAEDTVLTNSSLASSVGLYVYPVERQTGEQQSRDDYECYTSAKSKTGFDPVNPQIRPQVEESSIESRAGKESVKDVAGGATVGAIIGEIGRDDAGEGAAIGAVLGGIRAWKKNKAYKERQKRLAELEIDSEIEHNRLNFKNAFSACLTSRDYVVR